jgi:hypothetical protein
VSAVTGVGVPLLGVLGAGVGHFKARVYHARIF